MSPLAWNTVAVSDPVGANTSDWLIVWLLLGLPSIVALLDITRISPEMWRSARQGRGLWAVLVVLLGPLGALLYFTGPRLRLRQSARDHRSRMD